MDRRWILGGVLIAGGVGVARVLTYRPRFDDNSRILLIGDSFANGMARHFNTFASEEDLPFIGGAIDGTTCSQWANSDWLVRKLQEFQPTHVLISLGGNDAYSNFLPEQVADYAEELSEIISEHGAHPIWIGMPLLPDVYNGKHPNLDTIEAIKDVAPFYYDSSQLDIPRSPDELHPTAAGYAGWAATIWNWLS